MNIKEVVTAKAIKTGRIDTFLSIITFFGTIVLIAISTAVLFTYFNPTGTGFWVCIVDAVICGLLAYLWIKLMLWVQEKNVKNLIQFEREHNCYLLINPRCYIRKPGCWFNVTDSKLERFLNGENEYVFYFQPFKGDTCMKYSINASVYEAFNKTFEEASKNTLKTRGWYGDTIVFVDDKSLFEGTEEVTTVKASLGLE